MKTEDRRRKMKDGGRTTEDSAGRRKVQRRRTENSAGRSKGRGLKREDGRRRTEGGAKRKDNKRRRAAGAGERSPDCSKCKDRNAKCPGCPAQRDCRHCAYAGRVRDGRRVLLICVNCPGRLGQLTCVSPRATCRNFRARRKGVGRPRRRAPAGDDVCFIALTQDRFGMVEARDFKRLGKYKWCLCLCNRNKYYVRRQEKGRGIWMHREIMHPPPGMVVDHIQGNTFNNCRHDLRVCTRRENSYNSGPHGRTSRFKGVSYNEFLQRWEAILFRDGKKIPIGLFATEVEAARAHDRVARRVHGIYAWLNFPDEYPPHRRRRWRRRR